MEILLASNNRHKRDEFARLFRNHEIRMPEETGIDFAFEESGKDFLSNAIGKAMALFAMAHAPVIADDSGLCVVALEGAPGIHSHRFGAASGRLLDAHERNAFLLHQMAGVDDRRAYFVCCLALVLEESRFFIVQETVYGTIAPEPRGNGGFGYDPLFFVPELGKTIAELPDSQKDSLSHRGRAARHMLPMLAKGV